MKARLNYGWRLVATGMSFVVFGVCGLLFSLLVFPLAWLWPHRASREPFRQFRLVVEEIEVRRPARLE